MQVPGTTKKVERIETAIRLVLPRAVDLRVLKQNDSIVNLKVAGQNLQAQWLEAAWPSAIRQQLKERGERPPDVVVAKHLSAASRKELSNMGIGWVDESGAAEVAIGSLVVSRTGRQPEVKRIRGWTTSVVAVAEAVLCGTMPTVNATRAATGLSIGTCTNALRALTEMDLLVASSRRGRSAARSIANAAEMLAAYTAAANSKPPVSVTVGVAWRDPIGGVIELGRDWTRAGIEWAATGLVAADVMAPLHTTIGSANVYVAAESLPELLLVASTVNLVPLEGGRLTLTAFPTKASRQLVRSVDKMRVAPWPRVYADLCSIGVRGEEAAEHLREVVSGSRT